HLARIWRRQPPLRGRAPAMSAARFDELVLAKPYFDPQGLIIAENDDSPIGFVHAGFGPADDLRTLSKRQGVVSTLMVDDDTHHEEIADALLQRAEEYLSHAGAENVMAGGAGAICPFYLGLYGGSRLPGVLDSDTAMRDFYLRHGYKQSDHISVLHRELASFRPVTDRTQVQIRRSTHLDLVEDPPARSWWEACTLGSFEQIAVQMDPKDHGEPWAAARFWSMGPLGQAWGVNAVGLIDIVVRRFVCSTGWASFRSTPERC
ncbi:MAG: GNAT family N-acetyltransferase, partial [Planctomycetes bacterium]|nr:GNAT family N-acetyltransferase [Planctomycetota bacterium]